MNEKKFLACISVPYDMIKLGNIRLKLGERYGRYGGYEGWFVGWYLLFWNVFILLVGITINLLVLHSKSEFCSCSVE